MENEKELTEKVKMGLIKIKNFNLDKPDELLCVLTEESLSVIQKRMFDYFLWNAKQKIIKENITEADNFLKVEMPLNELITISGIQKTRQNKIIYLTNKLRQLKRIDIVKINLIKNATPLIRSKDDLINIKDEEIEEIVLTSPIGHFKINKPDNLITVYISPFIAEYLINTNSYTQVNFLVYSFLRSNYSISLYNYLLSKYQSQKALMKKNIIPASNVLHTEKIPIKKLMDILEIPPDAAIRKKSFWMLNGKILSKAINELNNEPTVEFEIELIKHTKGRKVTNVSFLLKEKEDKKIAVLDRDNNEVVAIPPELIEINNNNEIVSNPLLEIKEKILNDKNYTFGDFVKDLRRLRNVDITNVCPLARGKVLRVNDLGMLELDGEEVDNVKANLARRILFQNPELLGKFEEIDEEFEELKEKYTNKVLVYKSNGYYYAVGVKDLQKENEKIKVIGEELLRDIDNFSVTLSKDFLMETSPKEQLSLNDKDYYIQSNNQKELEELEELYEKNKDKFQEFLNCIEEESLKLSNELIKMGENSKEFQKKAKELETLDMFYLKGDEILKGENVSNVDKKMVFKKFKEFLKKKKISS